MLRFIIIVIFITSTFGLFGSNTITSLEDIKIESTYLEHISHSMALTGSGTIGGCITTHFGDPVKNVKVKLKSNQPDFPMKKWTNRHGKYKFEHLKNGFNYKICPSKKGDELNGVNFLDVFLLYKILRHQAYGLTPYSYIAADINNDQKINANDLVGLMNIIFRKIRTFPNNHSWRFVDADFQFIDESNPWPFMEDIQVDNLNGDSCENDFIAVKIGDLSGNAHTHYFDEAEERSDDRIALKVNDIFVQKNREYSIKIHLSSEDYIQGMQLFLSQSDIEIIDINTLMFNKEASYTYATNSTYKRMWYESNPLIDQSKNAVLNIKLRTKKSGMLSSILKLDKTDHLSEIYSGELEIKPELLYLDFDDALLETEKLTVLQNYPNPFTNKTFIEYNLLHAGFVHLKIIDTKGAIVYESTIHGEKGSNIISLTSDDIRTSGIFHYQLEFDKQVVTKTMIVTK